MGSRGAAHSVSLGLVSLGLTLALVGPVRADELVLADGEVVTGTVVARSDDSITVKQADGSLRIVKRDEVTRETAGKDAPRTPRRADASPPPRDGAPVGGIAALKAAARDGLLERQKVAGPSFELASYVPLRAEGRTFALSAAPRKVDLETAVYRDRTVDEVALQLWNERGTTSEDRYHALKLVAGAVAWLDAEVAAVGEKDPGEVTLDLRSTAARGRVKVRLARPVRPQDRIKLPVALVLNRDEASRFLAAETGETLARWPFDCVLLAGELQGLPATVSTDVSARLAERALDARVREWFRSRQGLRCSRCEGTRKLFCEPCEGKGKTERLIISVTGDSTTIQVKCFHCSGQGWRPCLACTDGLSELNMNQALRKYGAYGRPLSTYLDAGVKVTLSHDGKSATVSALVRYKDHPHDEPVVEKTTWKLDPKGQWVLTDWSEGGGAAGGGHAAGASPTPGGAPAPPPPSEEPQGPGH